MKFWQNKFKKIVYGKKHVIVEIKWNKINKIKKLVTWQSIYSAKTIKNTIT